MKSLINRVLYGVIVACIIINTATATKRRVLFIGNSYTYVNNMPLMLQNFATALGDTLIYDESDPGGYTFEMHSAYAPTISKIFSQPWDVVVLQEQSQRPSFPPTQVAVEVYPFALRLDSMIKANDSCTQTMFLMTWGRSNGDVMNCASYPVVCTFAGMQMRLRESYLQMAQDNGAVVAPVGVAWKAIKDSFASIGLYQSDSSHPSMEGSYLEMAVMYASIFHRPTYGCTYTSGLSTTTVQTLQRVADRVVFDSLIQWQQYGHFPSAAFKHALAGTTATFSGNSGISTPDSWDFGDGGHDTVNNPVHSYASSSGSYVVTHTVSNSCFTETIRDTIVFGTTFFQDHRNKEQVKVQHSGDGVVTFRFAGDIDGIFELFDISGRSLVKDITSNNDLKVELVPGMYLYKWTDAEGYIQAGKVLIY